jgi:hypothetical protein
MRLPIPFGRKGLIAALVIAAAVVFWRVRVHQQEAADQQWDEEVQGAIQEGVAAGRAAGTRSEPAHPGGA